MATNENFLKKIKDGYSFKGDAVLIGAGMLDGEVVPGADVLLPLKTMNRHGLIAGATGTLLSVIFPISPLMSSSFLGKSFVICVLGGLGSVPGVLVGGLTLGLVESFGAAIVGSEHSLTISFGLLLLLMVVRPTGLMGTRAFQ